MRLYKIPLAFPRAIARHGLDAIEIRPAPPLLGPYRAPRVKIGGTLACALSFFHRSQWLIRGAVQV
jgi:hypothetical protein